MPYEKPKKEKTPEKDSGTNKHERVLSKSSQIVGLLYFQYEKALLTFEEVCAVLQMSVQTGYNLKSEGRFPIPLKKLGKGLVADIRDVAEFLEHIRRNYVYLPSVGYDNQAHTWFGKI